MSDTDTVLVFDDDCGFCTWWAEYVDARSSIQLVGFSELSPELRERLPEHYEACSHLVTDDEVYSCGRSIEEAIARVDDHGPIRNSVDFFRNFEDYERLRETGYRWVADNRDKWGQVMSKTPPVRRESESESDR
ncbi:DCC1-like thiol-disulfide oxidoreductase family protein [Natronolimnobius baerhuensis]|uniref:Thiol-disulfide oxidoreductase n=1 Tax=Natronolimnobius baerhuensis TaxID=253108 RepID=A0A202E9Z4_9EURY|nr:DCC1-like thiol-disulfide oxidoreductase family protein [Natronolimnobius baerhuensis]OVE85039.1 thiol-disulfide oxidoreductase [Natronolimnobius baerhuensis]